MKPYYEHGGITIYHGDCRDVLPYVEADVLVTDPPYGINVGKNLSARETRPGMLIKGSYASYDDTPENYETTVVPAIRQCLNRVSRGCVFGFAPNIWKLPPPTAIGGVYVPAGCGRSSWGFTGFMPILLYGSAPHLERGCKPTCLYSTAVAAASDHPTPKPDVWMTWLLQLSSLFDDTVIDLFCGSGTTLIAAKLLGRRAIGIEIEERYCEIAANRLSQEVLALT